VNIDSIYIIDVETTGPDYFESDVLYIHISALNSDNDSLDVFIKYKENDLKWGSVAKRYFKSYKNEWESNAVGIKEAVKKINFYFDAKKKLETITLCGHNISFDYYFLKKLMHKSESKLSNRVSHKLIDVYSLLAIAYLKGLIPKYALSSRGAADYFKIDRTGRHSAKNDVKVTKETLKNILEILK